MVEEFPDDTPDFTDILNTFATRHCHATCTPKSGERARVPLCVEDMQETAEANPGLFDSEGFLCSASVCITHAR